MLVAPVGSVAPEASVATVGPVESVEKGFVIIFTIHLCSV